MFSRVIVSALFTCTMMVYSKPISNCNSQMTCMDLDITLQDDLDDNDKQQYEICFFWRDDLPECKKNKEISHACPSDQEKDKIEGWEPGRANAMCNIVSCGEFTQFGVKDGRSCDGGAAYGDFGITGYDEWVTCYDGGYCGGGNTKACRWLIEAPECEQTTTSTTEAPPQETDDDTASTIVSDNSCACEAVNDIPLFTNRLESCFAENGCAFHVEDGCFCHECDCSLINSEDGSPISDVIEECDACSNCKYEAAPGCIATDPVDETAANVYVRDPATQENTNLQFDNDPDTEEGSGATSMDVFGVGIYLVLIWIVNLCLV